VGRWPAAAFAADPTPGFIHGEIHRAHYDGVKDDLLTAGLGKSGLASSAAPAIADPARPTTA